MRRLAFPFMLASCLAVTACKKLPAPSSVQDGARLGDGTTGEAVAAGEEDESPDGMMTLEENSCGQPENPSVLSPGWQLNGADACSYKTVKVACGGTMTPGAYAQCEKGFWSATVRMPAEACASLGFQAGLKLTTSEFLAQPPRLQDSLAQAVVRCFLVHEMRHACDGKGMASCETEMNAYGHGVLCLQAYLGKFCGPGQEGSADCATLKKRIRNQSAMREWQACKCRGVDVAACSEACKATYPEFPKMCGSMIMTYGRK